MPKTLELKISRVTDFSAPFGNGEAGMGAGCSFTLLNPVTEEQWGYKFNLTFTSGSYVLSDCINLGTGQTVTFPYSYTDEPLHSMTLETSSTYYTVTVEFPDSLFLCNCIGLVASLPSGCPVSQVNFDFSPLLTSVATSANQNFLRLAAGTKESLASTLADLDIALSDATSKETASTPIIVSHFSSFLTGFKTLLTSISSASAFSTGSASDSDIVDANNLSGSYCKYVNGQVVYYGTYGLWVVTRAFLVLTSDNALTPFYDLRADDGLDSSGDPKYRYCTVPQDYVFPFIPVEV